MDLKFYLNKIIKIDNIEGYTLKTLRTLKNSYDKFLENSKGIDPDYPMLNFESKGKTINLKSGMTEEELDKLNL